MSDTYDVVTYQGRRYGDLDYIHELEGKVAAKREALHGRDALIEQLKAQVAAQQAVILAQAGRTDIRVASTIVTNPEKSE